MADLLTTPSFDYYESQQYQVNNVQSVAITGTTVSVIINYTGNLASPDGEEYYAGWFLGIYGFADEANRTGSDVFEVDDQTTGVSYLLPIVPGSAVATENTGIFTGAGAKFTFTTTSPPFQGVLTGVNPCFCAGTLLDTPVGPVAVEDLRPGDAVATTSGVSTVEWTGRRRATDAEVIHFRPHALGPDMPRRDLYVSGDHGMLVDDALVPAGLLVNGETVLAERHPTVTFHHLELARHAILLAEGAPAESYLDTGNRAQFGNCPLNYDPARPGGYACAEMVVAGTRLEQARRVLAAVRSPREDAAI